MIITTAMNTQAFLRLQCSSSPNVDTLVSNNEMALVKAANKNIKKNTTPTKVPIPILEKTFGNVIKVKEGPACSVDISPLEKAKTAGMIISPANKATPVSKNSTWEVLFSISTSFSIYEP